MKSTKPDFVFSVAVAPVENSSMKESKSQIERRRNIPYLAHSEPFSGQFHLQSIPGTSQHGECCSELMQGNS